MFRPVQILLLALSLPAMAQRDPWAESYRYEAQKNYAQAAQALQALPQTFELVQLRQAYLAYLQGRHDEAIKGYRKALEINPLSLDAQLGLPLPLLAQRKWNEAAVECRKVIHQCAWNYWAHLRLLVAEEGLQQWKVLAAHGKDLALRYPSDASAFVYWARGEARLGNRDEASRAYQRVLQLYPGHKEASDFLAGR